VDRFAAAGATDLGPRAAFLLAPVWYLIGAWLLRPVDERRRDGDATDAAESVRPAVEGAANA
jgi:hypothetical protein